MAGNTLSTPVAQQPQTTQGDPTAVGVGGSWLIDSQITVNKTEFGPDAVAANRDILATTLSTSSGAAALAAKGLDLTLELAKLQTASNQGLSQTLSQGIKELNAGNESTKADTSRLKTIVIGLVLVVAFIGIGFASIFKNRKT